MTKNKMRNFIAAAAMFLVLIAPAGAFANVADSGGGGLSGGDQKQCRQDYQGKTYNLKKDAQKKQYQKFKNSKCSKDKGGNCKATVKNNVAKISCSQPNNSATNTASVTDPALANGGCSGANCPIIEAYINPFIKLLSVLVGIAAVIAIILGAIEVITSAGDPQKAAQGRSHIRKALIGLVSFLLFTAVISWLIPGGII